MARSETMLGICKNIVFIIVCHDLAEYHMFNQLEHIISSCGEIIALRDRLMGLVCLNFVL